MPQEFVHLLPQEVAIWRRFLANPPWPIISVTYDLHLGEGIPTDPGWDEGIVRMVRAITRKRVDAVVRIQGATYIVEIKPRAGMSALGQCLAYRQLFLAEHSPVGDLRLCVVCERVETDMDRVFRAHQIELYVV